MKATRILAALISACGLLAATLPAQAAIKCWTNKEGVRECGEKVPPEYSQSGFETRNTQGMVTEETERARTAEEIEKAGQEAAAAAEVKRIALRPTLRAPATLSGLSSMNTTRPGGGEPTVLNAWR